MLGLVKTALQKPYTFIVLAIFICIIGPMAALRTPTDVFPDIGIPVVAVVWQYNGLSPDAMAGRVIYTYERSLSTTVNDIEHIESQSLPGMGIVKIFFQPGVDIRTANAQVTAVSQTVLKQMPPGITPPLILNYSASTVPILQMAFSSPTLSEAKIRDLVQNNIRLPLSALPGLAMPTPMGGKQRQITLDLDPRRWRPKACRPRMWAMPWRCRTRSSRWAPPNSAPMNTRSCSTTAPRPSMSSTTCRSRPSTAR